MVNMTVTPEEANYILQVLGNLPSNTGVWPLMAKLQAQVQAQLQPKQPETPPAAE